MSADRRTSWSRRCARTRACCRPTSTRRSQKLASAPGAGDNFVVRLVLVLVLLWGTASADIRSRARVRNAYPRDTPEAKARAALDVIDGATPLGSAGERTSVGQPWDGRLANGRQLAEGEGYVV